MRKFAVIALVCGVALAACTSTPAPPGASQAQDTTVVVVADEVSASFTASDGGEISTPSGLRLTIPPGALSEDAVVTLTPNASPVADEPSFGWLEGYTVDLGGATLNADVGVSYPVGGQVGLAREGSSDAQSDRIAVSPEPRENCGAAVYARDWQEDPPFVLATRDEDGQVWLRRVTYNPTEGRIERALRPLPGTPLEVGFIVIYPPCVPPTPVLEPVDLDPVTRPDPIAIPDPIALPDPDLPVDPPAPPAPPTPPNPPTPPSPPSPPTPPDPPPPPVPPIAPPPPAPPVPPLPPFPPKPPRPPLPIPPKPVPPKPVPPKPVPPKPVPPKPVPPKPIPPKPQPPVPPPPPPPGGPDRDLLQVPFYAQGETQWCVPTSLAMTINYHNSNLGLTSNWWLAGRNNQGTQQLTWPQFVMQNSGIQGYFFYRWDADLIPSNPFTNYVRLSIRGFNPFKTYGAPFPNIDLSPRPVQLGSMKLGHAFVAVGANAGTVWLHDSYAVFANTPAIAIAKTWGEFRNKVVDLTQTGEMMTMSVLSPARSEAERRGSIVLIGNSNPLAVDGSLVYRNVVNRQLVLSRWQWNGNPYRNGYYWDDPYNRLPDDATYGNRFPRGTPLSTAQLDYKLRVANVTAKQQTYTLNIRINGPGGNTFSSVNRTVPAYSWLSAGSLVSGSIEFKNLQAAGLYNLSFELTQNGVLQDVKAVSFVLQ